MSHPSAPVTGVILAGGLASRYGGRAKGLETVGGRRIVDRVAAALADAADALLLIANDARAEEWLPGVRRAADLRPDAGSLGGIHAALVHAGGPALVVAWDMPFVTAPLLRALRAAGADADAVVPESDSKRGLEPLCAFYGPACVPAIERRLDAGDRRVVSFYEDVRVRRLEAAAVAHFGDPARLFLNVNTPAELALAEAHAPTTDGGRRRQEA
jgi:molybdopterin-guanine dinucleotide biosynthesis protein A